MKLVCSACAWYSYINKHFRLSVAFHGLLTETLKITSNTLRTDISLFATALVIYLIYVETLTYVPRKQTLTTRLPPTDANTSDCSFAVPYLLIPYSNVSKRTQNTCAGVNGSCK